METLNKTITLNTSPTTPIIKMVERTFEANIRRISPTSSGFRVPIQYIKDQSFNARQIVHVTIKNKNMRPFEARIIPDSSGTNIIIIPAEHMKKTCALKEKIEVTINSEDPIKTLLKK